VIVGTGFFFVAFGLGFGEPPRDDFVGAHWSGRQLLGYRVCLAISPPSVAMYYPASICLCDFPAARLSKRFCFRRCCAPTMGSGRLHGNARSCGLSQTPTPVGSMRHAAGTGIGFGRAFLNVAPDAACASFPMRRRFVSRLGFALREEQFRLVYELEASFVVGSPITRARQRVGA